MAAAEALVFAVSLTILRVSGGGVKGEGREGWKGTWDGVKQCLRHVSRCLWAQLEKVRVTATRRRESSEKPTQKGTIIIVVIIYCIIYYYCST